MNPFRHLLSPDGRRAGAFLVVLGGAIVMTLFAAFGVYILRNDAEKAFWLALAAHAQILVGMTALSALLVKRTLKVGRDGITIEDDSE